jgi:hypothetical protein
MEKDVWLVFIDYEPRLSRPQVMGAFLDDKKAARYADKLRPFYSNVWIERTKLEE